MIATGVSTTPSGEEFAERLLNLSRDLTELINKYQPDLVAIEKLFFAKNSQTGMKVAEARGVTLVTLAQAGLKIVEFTPAQIKMAVTGDGKADKQAVQQMVQRLLSLDRVPRPDDAADALAVAITAVGVMKCVDKE
ncbi:crossover junction endodeoxyribonuclease RuvC [Patescibacteria group bacterium]